MVKELLNRQLTFHKLLKKLTNLIESKESFKFCRQRAYTTGQKLRIMKESKSYIRFIVEI